MKTLVTLIGAAIGIAASLVVMTFPLALSPYFAFLVLVGVGLWLRDVRRSQAGSQRPNWRSFFWGSAVWVALPVGLLMFKNWLTSVPASAASPSAISIAMLVFGTALIALGVYRFRAHPSQRIIENWAQWEEYMPMSSAIFPWGIAFAILGADLLVSPPMTLRQLILIPVFAFVFAGIVLMIWQPRWTKPPWLRRYQKDSG